MRRSSPIRSPIKRAGSPQKKNPENQQELDPRDLTLSQLKEELFEIRQNVRDYSDLHLRLTNLEHRYSILQEEKGLNEAEFKTRYEIGAKNISGLKEQSDFLKKDYNAVTSSNTSTRTENKNITDIIESRVNEVNRLNLQIDDIDMQNGRLDIEKQNIDSNLKNIKNENVELNARVAELQKYQDELTQNTIANDKILKELEQNITKLERTQTSMNKDQDAIRLDIYNKTEKIRFAEVKLNENQKAIINLEGDINDLKKTNERIRNEIEINMRNQRTQYHLNLECQSRSIKLDKAIDNRDEDILNLRKQLEGLKQKHFDLVNVNEDLNNDIEVATKHLTNITQENHDLVIELEKYQLQDKKIRSIIDRKERVDEVIVKTEEKMKQSANKMSASLKSPQRRRYE